MLIGHYGPALLLHRSRPRVPLWVLFVAVQFVDVLWGLFIFGGIEHARIVPGFTESNGLDLYDMPYTHSLVMTFVWATAAALGWRVWRGSNARVGEAVVVGLAVASHFFLDLPVHVRDLPIVSSEGAKWGLGLWRHRELALGVELLALVLPAIVWLRASWQPAATAQRRVLVLAVMAVVLVATFYVPTPPSPTAMALTGLSTYALWAAMAAWASPAAADEGQVEKGPALKLA